MCTQTVQEAQEQTMQRGFALNRRRDAEDFVAFWKENLEGSILRDLLAVPPPFEWGKNDSFWSYFDGIVLRTDETDIRMVVDTSGASVAMEKLSIAAGQPVDTMLFIRNKMVSLQQVLDEGPEKFGLSIEFVEEMRQRQARWAWQRLEDWDIIGKPLGDVQFEYTTPWEKYTYCSEVRVRVGDCTIHMKDQQDQMIVNIYPARYSTK